MRSNWAYSLLSTGTTVYFPVGAEGGTGVGVLTILGALGDGAVSDVGGVVPMASEAGVDEVVGGAGEGVVSTVEDGTFPEFGRCSGEKPGPTIKKIPIPPMIRVAANDIMIAFICSV